MKKDEILPAQKLEITEEETKKLEKIESKMLWDRVKAGYLSGMTQKELAKTYHVDKSSLQSRINREGWHPARERLQDKIVDKIVQPIARRIEAVADRAERRMEQLDAELERSLRETGKISSGSLKAQADALKSLNETMRVSLGLPDKITPSVQINVQLNHHVIEAVNVALAKMDTEKRLEGGS